MFSENILLSKFTAGKLESKKPRKNVRYKCFVYIITVITLSF